MNRRKCEQGRWGFGAGIAALLIVGVTTLASAGGRWTEEDFSNKARLTKPYIVVPGNDPATIEDGDSAAPGSTRATQGDTFLDLARFYGLGYNEIEQANPGSRSVGSPGRQARSSCRRAGSCRKFEYDGRRRQHPGNASLLLPPARKTGQLQVTTYPVGFGRDEWRTPNGKFTVQGKTSTRLGHS